MTTLYLVRHAATQPQQEGRFVGVWDVPINDHGRRQLVATAATIGAIPNVAAVYSSPLLRARQTADGIAAAHNLAPRLVPGLAEFDFGAFDQLTMQEIIQRDRRAYAEAMADRAAFPDGERLRDFHVRVRNAADGIVASPAHETVVIVAHGWTIGSLCSQWFQGDGRQFMRYGSWCCGITQITFDAAGPTLITFSEHEHLKGISW